MFQTVLVWFFSPTLPMPQRFVFSFRLLLGSVVSIGVAAVFFLSRREPQAGVEGWRRCVACAEHGLGCQGWMRTEKLIPLPCAGEVVQEEAWP